MNLLQWLMNWYYSNCDDDWEHSYGITIETLDNSGWSINIELTDTDVYGKDFYEINIDKGDDDWIVCRIRSDKFEGRGDSFKLELIIETFKDWVEN